MSYDDPRLWARPLTPDRVDELLERHATAIGVLALIQEIAPTLRQARQDYDERRVALAYWHAHTENLHDWVLTTLLEHVDRARPVLEDAE